MTVTAPPESAARVQRRTLALLTCTQVLGGVGVVIGITVGVLQAQRLGGVKVSGFASASAVVGAALLAVPVSRLMRARGRRPGLAVAYLVGAAGAALVVLAAVLHLIPLLFLGMALFGGGNTANLQARYAAVDLADPAHRGRQLSLVVWATTVGAVAAPSIAAFADRAGRGGGLPPLSGPFALSVVVFTVTALLLLALMRPDPLLTARRLAAAAGAPADPVSTGGRAGGAGVRAALAVVSARPAARLGVVAVAVGHLVMVSVMTMTPVYIGTYHHGDVLRIVGLVLSAHIAGMYAFSPLTGWLTDRIGRRPVILLGVALQLVACAVAGTAGHGTPILTLGLFLLGLGWSGTMVAGSTLLSESVPVAVRPSVQGLSDLVMGLAGAAGGALSGIVVGLSGYPTLTVLAAVAAVPLVALALRPAPVPVREG
jgi:MFS family permease